MPNMSFKKVNILHNVYNKKKLSMLFEISELNGNEFIKNSSEMSCNISENDSNESNYNENNNDNSNEYETKNLKINLNKRNSLKKYNTIQNSKIGYLVKAKNKKISKKNKKIGINENDFLI